eukprot:3423811-Prymnesium_polylepis.1
MGPLQACWQAPRDQSTRIDALRTRCIRTQIPMTLEAAPPHSFRPVGSGRPTSPSAVVIAPTRRLGSQTPPAPDSPA